MAAQISSSVDADRPSSKTAINRQQVRVLAEQILHRLIVQQTVDGFTDQQLLTVVNTVRKQLVPVPALITLSAPVVVFGDIHGQFNDLQRFFAIVGTPPSTRCLFLGDYVDRCRKSLEVIMQLLCYKLLYPDRIDLLRGNHECQKMNRLYGFYEECKRKRNVAFWKAFQPLFSELPLVAVVSKRILCMHGGFGPSLAAGGWKCLGTLEKPRTTAACEEEGPAMDLMWADPHFNPCTKGFVPNHTRGVSFMFGHDVIREVTDVLDVDLIVRAHEVVPNGFAFYGDDRLLTLFSAPNYCGTDGNSGSIMSISADLRISFDTLKPVLRTPLSSCEGFERDRETKAPETNIRRFTLFNSLIASPLPTVTSSTTLTSPSSSTQVQPFNFSNSTQSTIMSMSNKTETSSVIFTSSKLTSNLSTNT